VESSIYSSSRKKLLDAQAGRLRIPTVSRDLNDFPEIVQLLKIQAYRWFILDF